ncbi:hypothetical protein HPULCUR_001317 [Helicostylum pulchrum]|uniref:Uncharacterized protein n=1 Tax=Helicostylum pulchrum TaxID=562976 RepID=A0ABP9XPD0_9FUNG
MNTPMITFINGITEYLEDSLINLEQPNDNNIRKNIENFAIKPDDTPVSNIMQGRNRDIIDRCFQFDTVAEILGVLEKEGSEFSLNTMNEICLSGSQRPNDCYMTIAVFSSQL